VAVVDVVAVVVVDIATDFVVVSVDVSVVVVASDVIEDGLLFFLTKLESLHSPLYFRSTIWLES